MARRPIDARELKPALDRLYAAFDHPESAFDPVQVVRRYPAVADREIVAFLAAGLAFGRVASVVASVEGVCGVLGARPAALIRGFDPARHGVALRPLVHRWIRGADLVALFVILREMLREHGSLEAAFASGLADSDVDVGPALERFSTLARAIDLREAYGRRNEKPGAHYFLARPSTGSACKRLNLFLRWMSRRDGVDPGGWTRVPPRQLVVPLDTHTIRVGRCLGLTRRASSGWKMAVDITDALRRIDPDDPVRYDFSLCHLSMMGGCGYRTRQRDSQCPLRGLCRPAGRR
ncbi:MAG TPA: TIGR02757 family protein [Vicinamibacterales bacterium]|nr:TIGR02757 family protein [Vicinamibacterales bacterium]